MSCQSYSTAQPTSPTNCAGVIASGGVKIVAFLCNWCSYAGADKVLRRRRQGGCQPVASAGRTDCDPRHVFRPG